MPTLSRRTFHAHSLMGLAALPFLSSCMSMNGQPASTYGQTGGQPGTSRVAMRGMAFSPTNLSVAAGQTVTFVNDDLAPHTVTADDGSFDTETLEPGRAAQITFSTVGTHTYFCEIHPMMRGVVTVT